MSRKSRKRRSPARTVEEVGGAVWTGGPCQRGNRVDVLSKLKIRLLRLFERPLQILVLRQYRDDGVEPLKVLNRTLVDEPGLIRKNASQVNFPPLLRPSLICDTETIWQPIPWIGVRGWSHTLIKGLASPILRYSHFIHSKRVGRSPLIGKTVHDQYATIPEKCHVVQNRVLSQNTRKPPEREAYD
jgi:hypothetical protein